MKELSLRFKVTLLVGVVLIIACLTLTINSLYSARGYYGGLEKEIIVDSLPEPESLDSLKEGELVLPDTSSLYATATLQFSLQSIVVMVAAIILSLIAAYCLTGRLLSPLTVLTDSIRKINQEHLHQRVVLPEATGEVRELEETFNRMMDRLEKSFLIQKNFTANAAHELKTPMSLLKTSLQVLEMDEAPSLKDYQEFTHAARVGIDRLTETVNALMVLAENGEEYHTETVEIRPLLQRVLNELSIKADAAEIVISVIGKCPNVHSDQTLIYRLIFNLVENAIKYNHPGGSIKITLSEGDGRSILCIEDNGMGMSAEAVEHAFEPFYRADKSRSQKIPGSGLGLSVAKIITERIQGELKLESRLGAGTRVTLRL